jgi:hypothetical protein
VTDALTRKNRQPHNLCCHEHIEDQINHKARGVKCANDHTRILGERLARIRSQDDTITRDIDLNASWRIE